MYSHCFNVIPPFLYLFGLARFPSFCHASFSLCFTAGHRGEGHVYSLSHQKGLASQRANMFQCQPYGRKLWVVCWHMQGWARDLALCATTIRAPHLQLLHFWHMCRLKVLTDAFMALIIVCSCCPMSNSRRLCSEWEEKQHACLPLCLQSCEIITDYTDKK